MDIRLGCLQKNIDPELARVFQATNQFLGSFGALRTSLSWRLLPNPRWNKAYREAQDNLDILLDFGKKHIQTAKYNYETGKTDTDQISILKKMVRRCDSESSYPLVMALDMIFGGIDTTGNTIGFLMYHLAANPDKQEILRKECLSIGPNLNVKNLNELCYLKACIQETFRLTPTISMLVRMLQENVTLQGYEIPKDTLAIWSTLIFQEQFTNHDKFLPERWLKGQCPKISPYSVRPFSHGPRMCIGKRFAELEMLIVVHKLMTNFEIKWANKEPLTISQVLLNVPDQSLKFQFKDLNI